MTDVSAAVRAAWDRIEAHLRERAPHTLESLLPETTEERLAACEKKIGRALPDDVRASFLIHDGQADDGQGIFPPATPDSFDIPHLLLPLEGVLRQWSAWKELTDGGEFEGQSGEPDAGVRDDWWNTGWISLTYDGGGDSQCVDLAPADGGTVGQVIGMNHETGRHPLFAPSWLDRLLQIADHLDCGTFLVGEEGDINWAEDDES